MLRGLCLRIIITQKVQYNFQKGSLSSCREYQRQKETKGKYQKKYTSKWKSIWATATDMKLRLSQNTCRLNFIMHAVYTCKILHNFFRWYFKYNSRTPFVDPLFQKQWRTTKLTSTMKIVEMLYFPLPVCGCEAVPGGN